LPSLSDGLLSRWSDEGREEDGVGVWGVVAGDASEEGEAEARKGCVRVVTRIVCFRIAFSGREAGMKLMMESKGRWKGSDRGTDFGFLNSVLGVEGVDLVLVYDRDEGGRDRLARGGEGSGESGE
jgi:hypothetical protein